MNLAAPLGASTFRVPLDASRDVIKQTIPVTAVAPPDETPSSTPLGVSHNTEQTTPLRVDATSGTWAYLDGFHDVSKADVERIRALECGEAEHSGSMSPLLSVDGHSSFEVPLAVKPMPSLR